MGFEINLSAIGPMKVFMTKKKKDKKKRGVSHCGLAIYIEKYLKAKEKIMETQIFHYAKI
jgi:putative sterol carrier protein